MAPRVTGPEDAPAGGLVAVADPAALERVADVLAGGLVAAVPTDTVYGLAARIDRPEAIDRLFELKGRRRDAAIAVLVGDLGQARRMGLASRRGRRLAEALWPGPLTIVVERPACLTADIGGDGLTVGIRMPGHAALRRLLAQTGPLATTSANPSGEPTPATAAGVAAVFGPRVGVYLDGGPSGGGVPSTVVSDVGSELLVLREGPIGAAAIRAVAAGA
jgi:L-threonylcarbamoyladenylate synthase